MADKVVQIPGVGNVSFPDSMSQGDIDAASAKLYKEKQGALGMDVSEGGAAHLATGPQTLTDSPDVPLDHPSFFSMDFLKQPLTKERLIEAMSTAAHPQTIGDFLGLLIPSGISNAAAGYKRTVSDTTKEAVANVGGDIREGIRTANAAVKEPENFFQAGAFVPKYATNVIKGAFASQAERDAARAAPVAEAVAAKSVGPVYHSDPAMQAAFEEKAAARLAAKKAAERAAKTAAAKPPVTTKAPIAPVLGRNIVKVKAGIPDLSPDEIQQSLKWLQGGIAPDQIIERINAARELQASVGGTGTATAAAAEVKARPHYKHFGPKP